MMAWPFIFIIKIPHRPMARTSDHPVIPVLFFNGVNSFETAALLDSGADITAIYQEMAEVLGLDLSGPREKCYGVAGSVESVLSRIKLSLGKDHERYTFTVPVKVLQVQTSQPHLLGQVGFFDEFKITFDKNASKITLIKVDTGDRKLRSSD